MKTKLIAIYLEQDNLCGVENIDFWIEIPANFNFRVIEGDTGLTVNVEEHAPEDRGSESADLVLFEKEPAPVVEGHGKQQDLSRTYCACDHSIEDAEAAGARVAGTSRPCSVCGFFPWTLPMGVKLPVDLNKKGGTK